VDGKRSVYAVPSLRGGGEYGKNGDAGTKMQKKQNVFDDFIAAAEYPLLKNILPQIFLLFVVGQMEVC
jgi:prolyl oligopeptidase